MLLSYFFPHFAYLGYVLAQTLKYCYICIAALMYRLYIKLSHKCTFSPWVSKRVKQWHAKNIFFFFSRIVLLFTYCCCCCYCGISTLTSCAARPSFFFFFPTHIHARLHTPLPSASGDIFLQWNPCTELKQSYRRDQHARRGCVSDR